MANRKISALASHTNANLASGDLFHVVDISEADDADKNKSITVSELDLRYLNDLGDVDLSGQTEKTTPVAADLFMLGDSAASFANKKLTFNNLNANLDHDALTNFVANEHVDHTSVTLTAGEGLTGGGDISANRSFVVDYSDFSNTATTVAATDLVSIYEATTNNRNEKITFANFEGALSHDNLTGFVANEHIDWTSTSSNLSTTGTAATGALTVTGNTILNGASVTLSQDTDFVLSGGVNGMSIDGTTFSVDGLNNRVGIGTASPAQLLEVKGSDPIVNLTNSDAANVANTASLDMRINSDSSERTYFRIETTSSTITDASRESTVDFKVNSGGSFVDAMTIVGTDIGIGQAPVTGSKLSLPQENDAATPTISFGDGDTGFYEGSDDVLNISIAGTLQWQMTSNAFLGNETGSPQILSLAASSTSPCYAFESDGDTGIGRAAANELSLITAATEAINIDSSQRSTFKGPVNLAAATELTIATAAITITKSFHTVDTEADAATDDLETINGGSEGDELVLTAASGARDVVLKDNTGNLRLAGDFTLDNVNDTIRLIFNGTNWLEVSRSNNQT